MGSNLLIMLSAIYTRLVNYAITTGVSKESFLHYDRLALYCFLGVWLVSLPIGIYDESLVDGAHWLAVPVVVIIGGFLLGIEELASQIEEPFSILPLEAMCDDMERQMDEVVAMAKHD